jgi:superfamily II DNA or RNA helicase
MDKVRQAKQLSEIEKWRKSKLYGAPSYGRGIFKWVTGMGKTYASCLLIDKYLESTPKAQVLILVSVAEHVKQWTLTINNVCESDVSNVKVMTTQYYQYHNLNVECDLLIIDEIHTFYSNDRLKIITGQSCKYKHILGLSATPEDDNNVYHTVVKKVCPVISTVTEEEAIYNGWISDYIEFNLAVPLTDKERTAYNDLSETITELNAYFEDDFQNTLKCIRGDKEVKAFEYATNFAVEYKNYNNLQASKEEIDNPNDVMEKAKAHLAAVRRRKVLLQHLISKSEVTLELIDLFDDRKCMIFSEDTAFADIIHTKVQEKYSRFNENYSVLYHSNLKTELRTHPKTGNPMKFGKTRLKNEAIEFIREGKSKVLVTAKALDAGFDVNDIDVAIITSGTSNYIQQKQRTGRSKRISSNNSIIVNLYGDGTKDASTLRYRQRKSNQSKVYWIENIKDIYNYID